VFNAIDTSMHIIFAKTFLFSDDVYKLSLIWDRSNSKWNRYNEFL